MRSLVDRSLTTRKAEPSTSVGTSGRVLAPAPRPRGPRRAVVLICGAAVFSLPPVMDLTQPSSRLASGKKVADNTRTLGQEPKSGRNLGEQLADWLGQGHFVHSGLRIVHAGGVDFHSPPATVVKILKEVNLKLVSRTGHWRRSVWELTTSTKTFRISGAGDTLRRMARPLPCRAKRTGTSRTAERASKSCATAAHRRLLSRIKCSRGGFNAATSTSFSGNSCARATLRGSRRMPLLWTTSLSPPRQETGGVFSRARGSARLVKHGQVHLFTHNRVSRP